MVNLKGYITKQLRNLICGVAQFVVKKEQAVANKYIDFEKEEPPIGEEIECFITKKFKGIYYGKNFFGVTLGITEQPKHLVNSSKYDVLEKKQKKKKNKKIPISFQAYGDFFI